MTHFYLNHVLWLAFPSFHLSVSVDSHTIRLKTIDRTFVVGRFQSIASRDLESLEFRFFRLNRADHQVVNLTLFGPFDEMVSNPRALRLHLEQNSSILAEIDIFVAFEHVYFGTDVVKLQKVFKTYFVEIS